MRKGDPLIVRDGIASVDIEYPRANVDRPDECHTVEVDLVDVRSTDSVRVTYHFDRNGWVILQASRDDFNEDGDDQDPGWEEVAFIPSWGRWEKDKS